MKHSQVLSVVGRKTSRLGPAKQHPKADHVGYKQDGIENEVAADVSKALADNGHQRTEDEKTSRVLKKPEPD